MRENRVRQLRKEAGLTVPELARMASVSISTIQKMERGDKSCTIATLLYVAQALAVDPDTLLGWSSAYVVTDGARRLLVPYNIWRNGLQNGEVEIERTWSGLRRTLAGNTLEHARKYASLSKMGMRELEKAVTEEESGKHGDNTEGQGDVAGKGEARR